MSVINYIFHKNLQENGKDTTMLPDNGISPMVLELFLNVKYVFFFAIVKIYLLIFNLLN